MKNTELTVKVERMHMLDGDGPTVAFCDLLILETFLVKGLRVIRGKEGLFVSMPREQGRDGKWYDNFFPVAKDMREEIQNIVLEYYEGHAARSRK